MGSQNVMALAYGSNISVDVCSEIWLVPKCILSDEANIYLKLYSLRTYFMQFKPHLHVCSEVICSTLNFGKYLNYFFREDATS